MQEYVPDPGSELPPAALPGRPTDTKRSRTKTLLAITELIVDGSTLPDLFKNLVPLLLELADCDLVIFALYDGAEHAMATEIWTKGGEVRLAKTFPVEGSLCGWVWKQQECLTLPDIKRETRFEECLAELGNLGVRSFAALPLSTTSERIGVLGLGKVTPEIRSAVNLEMFAGVARVVALALENRKARTGADQRQQRLQNLLAISHGLNSSLELDRLLPIIFEDLRQLANCDWAMASLPQEDPETLRVYTADWARGHKSRLLGGQRQVRMSEATAAQAITTRCITHWNAEDLKRFSSPTAKEMLEAGTQSLCHVPLVAHGEVLGALSLGSLRKGAFREDDASLRQVANLFASAIRNAQAFGEIAQLKDRLAQEKRYLESEIREETRVDEIVGNSPALKRVLENAAIVAHTDATVLIGGETGTGKERIARAIHMMSSRKDRNFIKLNCAAIPTGLLESELFGHEKGAFTGAVTQKVGRLELADKGTLLLDEIGDIPLELQPKLLRVLQDQEFERLGGTKTIRVDVRLIAASNRDLERAVAEKEFRSDLFYRLHVFPLHLPPLRERREDIPLLVRHFVERCAVRLHKKIDFIPDEAVEAMMNWPWPGNIRELENFIERSVILSDGNRLRPPLAELRPDMVRRPLEADGTLRDRERDHIVDILRLTRGVLSGHGGAADRLGLKRTTLQSKMQKLGISRNDYLD
jgi:formate hydrogenlyase transcriptional activator